MTGDENVNLILYIYYLKNNPEKYDNEGLWICSMLEEQFRREHGTRKSYLMIQITKLLGGLLTAETFSDCFERSGFTA